jgi:hypothetical protein
VRAPRDGFFDLPARLVRQCASPVLDANFDRALRHQRHNLDADLRLIPWPASMGGLGVPVVEGTRSRRSINEATPHITRLTGDSVGTRWLTLRSKFETRLE